MGREKVLRGELAKAIGEAAANDPTARGVYWIHRTEKSTQDFDFLGSIANALLDTQPGSGSLEAPIAIISSGAPGIVPSLLVVISPAQGLAKKVYEDLKTALEAGEKGRVKGGGAKGRFMSKVDGKWGKAESAAVQAIIDQVG